MKTQRIMLRATMLALACFVLSGAALAANNTFVSAKTGNDAHACTAMAPCLTFKKALAVTSAGGTVFVQDSGSYPPFAINKSVFIVANGVDAVISAFSGDGIDINAASSDVVSLHGLTIKGVSGLIGVNVTSVGQLHIEKCVITGFNASAAGGGIYFNTAGQLRVSDTTLRDDYYFGIYSIGMQTTVNRVQNNGGSKIAVYAAAGDTTVRDTIVTNCVNGYATDGSATSMTVENSAATDCGFGVSATTGSTIRLAATTVTKNFIVGLVTDSTGSIRSFGDNNVDGNATNFSGHIVQVARH